MGVRMNETPLEKFIAAWLRSREVIEDCSCEEEDPNGGCWYHLTKAEQDADRLKSFTDAYNFEYGPGDE